MGTVDKFAPTKKKRVRNKPAPWLNMDIKKIMKRRDELKRNASKFKDENSMKLYRKARNLVTNVREQNGKNGLFFQTVT